MLENRGIGGKKIAQFCSPTLGLKYVILTVEGTIQLHFFHHSNLCTWDTEQKGYNIFYVV